MLSGRGNQVAKMATSDAPVTIKKYANRRLYNTATSTYVTHDDLAAMVKRGEDSRHPRRQGRGHYALSPDADRVRAREQGRAEPAAHQFPALAYPLLRRQHYAGVALS